MSHHLPSVRHLFKNTVSFVRAHGRSALPALAVFIVAIGAAAVALVYGVLQFGQFSEGTDPESVMMMVTIVLPALLCTALLACANWVWVALWSRKGPKSMRGFWRSMFPLLWLYVVYKFAVGIPAIALGAVTPDVYIPLVQLLLMLWTLYVLSRGVLALLLVSRDAMPVMAAIRKSVVATRRCWPAVAVRLFLGWFILVAVIVGVILLSVGVRMQVVLPDLVTMVVAGLLLLIMAQLAAIFSLSFLQRLGEDIESLR